MATSQPTGHAIALLCNKVAGGGRGEAVAAAFSNTFGPGAPVFDTPAPGQSLELLAARLRQTPLATLCIAGGDGTLHLAVNLLLAAYGEQGAWPQLALLPAGSANDGARALAALAGRPTPRDWREALRDLTARMTTPPHEPVHSDVGLLRAGALRRAFANFAAAGSPADWAELSARRWLAPLKRVSVAAAYQLCNLEVIVRRKIHALEIGLDGASPTRHELFAWFAANARFLGGGIDFGETVRLDSGQLAIVALPRASRRELVHTLNAAKRGQGPASTPARRVSLRLPEPARLNLDGELLTLPDAAVELSVLPGRAAWV